MTPLANLILLNIFIAGITLSMLGYYFFDLEKKQTSSTQGVRNTINAKLDNLTTSMTKVLSDLANATIHLANTTQTNNATLHQILNNVSSPQSNATILPLGGGNST